jgi:hypothetical protein
MLVHLDGFDSYSVVADLALEYTYSVSSFSTSTGRFGGGAIYNGYITKNITPTTELWTGFACKWLSGGLYSDIITFTGGAGIEAVITALNGGIQLRLGSRGGTVVASCACPQNFIASMWHWFEVRYKYGTSAGVVEIWLDGVQLLTYTGNVSSAAGGSISQIQYCNTSNSVIGYLDDLYIIDVAAGGANTTRLGDCRIGTLVPTSNASPNQATPSTGSAYTCVDEAQWNTSDYVTFTSYSAGKVEAYGMSSLPSTPTAIYGVRVLAIGDKSDAGSAGFYPYIASGGSSALGAGQPLSTSWGHIYSIFEIDPHTSAAWATAAVNAMACGVQTV